jgi:hypothetical protein
VTLSAAEQAELMEILRARVAAILPRSLALAKQIHQLLAAVEHAPDGGDVRMFALQLALRHLGNSAAEAFERTSGRGNGDAVVETMCDVFEAAIDRLEQGQHPSDGPLIVVVSS